MSKVTFSMLRDANIKRLPQFKNKKGELAHPNPDGSDWTPLEWVGAAAGELGELANIVKKVRRGDISPDDIIEDKGRRITVREWIAKEAADVVCYLDILAYQFDLDLGEAVRRKFNEVSHDIGVDVFIPGHEGSIYNPHDPLARTYRGKK
jgi:NTP pyrophosphatase (non-canonical NTP hydrolase)